MKKYDELWLSWKQHMSILEGVPGHNHGLEDYIHVIGKSVMFHIQREDEREQFWWDGVLVTVSAGVTDTGSSYGVVVTAYDAPKPNWWWC